MGQQSAESNPQSQGIIIHLKNKFEISCLDGKLSFEDFKRLLAKNQKVLSEYVEERLSVGTLERWVQTKTKAKGPQRKKSLRRRSRLCDWKVINIFCSDIIRVGGISPDYSFQPRSARQQC